MASRIVLSGSTNGRRNLINVDSGAPKTIHAAGATAIDQVWIWATNLDAVTGDLTLVWAGGPPLITMAIAPNTTELVVDGLRISDSDTITAYVTTTGSENMAIHGSVNRHDA